MIKWYIGIIAIALLFALTACNLRENVILPPDLIPEDYIENSYIYSVDNFMVKSTNDDAFLYISKAAIADSTIHLQDTIIFEKTRSLTDRDSLHVNTTDDISAAYNFYVYRDSTLVSLTLNTNYPNITIYAEKTGSLPSGSQGWCLNQSVWLDAIPATVDNYTDNRITFHPYGTGCNQAVGIDPLSNELTFTAENGNHFAFSIGAQDRVSYYLPVSTDNTIISITNPDSLEASSVEHIQTVFPTYTVFSSISNIKSSAALGTSTSTPLMRLHNLSLGNRYPLQWVVESSNQVFAWQESPETWVMSGNELIAPCRINGNYLLIIPLESQNSLTLPLDAGFRQVYAVDFWLDLTDVDISNTSLTICNQEAISSGFGNYLNGEPYQLNNQYGLYRFSFTQNGTELAELPSEQWVEIGFKVTNATTSNRLFRYFGTTAQDIISYKTYASAYDEEHFTITDNMLYVSLSQSGEYLYASASTNPSSIRIPVLKAGGQFQTDRIFALWSNAKKRQYTYFTFDYLTSFTTGNPWFNGYPFQMTGYQGYVKSGFETSGVITESVPSIFYLEYDIPVTTSFGHLVLYSSLNKNYLAKLYKAGNSADADNFIQSGSRITCYPVSGGTHILANISNLNNQNKYVAMFKSMSIDFDTLKIWMQSSQELPAGTNLHINSANSFADPLNVLTSQYNLTPTSPAYMITAETNGIPGSGFYDQNTPLVYLKRNTRRTEYLFTLNQDSDYRIYSYEAGTEADGYHFVTEDGYNKFLLVHNGQFGTFSDNNPHNQITATVTSTTQDLVLSLYQAEFILPVGFTALTELNGYRFYLDKLTNLASYPNAVSGYTLRVYDSQNNADSPGFIANFLQPRYPVLYIPFPASYADQTINLFFINPLNETLQFTQVEDITAANQFIVYGNCAICLVNNPGTYYITTSTSKSRFQTDALLRRAK